MRIETRLKQEAREACTARGHEMVPFVTLVHPTSTNGQAYVARSVCINCGKYVQIETKPALNSIDIGGNAVALGC